MNWLKSPQIYKLILFFVISLITACGVKGDPLPPEKPPSLGRGRPTYKRATEDIQIQKSKTPAGSATDKNPQGTDDDNQE